MSPAILTSHRLRGFILAAVTVLFGMVITAAPVHAEGTYDECISRTNDAAAASQLKKEGLVSEDELRFNPGLTTGYNLDDVEKIKNGPHKKRFQEILDHYENDGGFGLFAGDIANTVQCRVAQPIEAVGNAASSFWDSSIGEFTKSVMEGNTQAFQTAMIFWMNFSTTNVDVDANTRGVKNIAMGLAGFALIASFIVGGWRLVSARRGGLSDGLGDMNDNMVRWLIFSIAVPAMFPGAMVASDILADTIMNELGGGANQLVNLGGLEESTAGPVVMLVLAGIMLVGSFVQILALITRVLLAPVAVGLTPLFAALSFTEAGKQGLNHLVSFLIAAIAFKPVSAIVYAVVLWNVGREGDIGIAGGVVNALMIGLAGFTAPALVKALVPAVAQAGGGGSAPMLAGATGAVVGAAGAASGALGAMGRTISGTGKSAAGTGAQAVSAGGSSSAAGTGVASSGGSKAGKSGADTSAQPSGASAAGGSSRRGNRTMRAASATVRMARRRAGATLTGAGVAAGGVATTARSIGNTAHHMQGIFDDSIGTPGGYAGQVHR